MKTPSPLAVALALALVTALTFTQAQAEPGDAGRHAVPVLGRPIVKTKEIAPGLVFTKITERQVPRRTFVLTMTPSMPVTLDVTLTRPTLPALQTLSRVANAHDALAAVNGDYSGEGDPDHPMSQDGQLVHTSPQLGILFAMAADESQTFFGKPAVGIDVTDSGSGLVLPVSRWNDGPPRPGEMVGYSPVGGTLEAPPPNACSVRLLPTGPLALAQDSGVEQDYQVDVATCSKTPTTRDGGIVLAAPPATDEATQLLALTPGTPMRLRWTFGWPGVLDAVGGAPLLVQDGTLVGMCNSACGRHPRTGIGVTADGSVLLVVVDGRQPKWSIGASMDEFARIMQGLGAVNALNLDGGGSSEMVVQGEIVNRPSDGRERRISNAILVLPGPDPGES